MDSIRSLSELIFLSYVRVTENLVYDNPKRHEFRDYLEERELRMALMTAL